jgi:hypothetical protein
MLNIVLDIRLTVGQKEQGSRDIQNGTYDAKKCNVFDSLFKGETIGAPHGEEVSFTSGDGTGEQGVSLRVVFRQQLGGSVIKHF